jgi:hypothetical protein
MVIPGGYSFSINFGAYVKRGFGKNLTPYYNRVFKEGSGAAPFFKKRPPS